MSTQLHRRIKRIEATVTDPTCTAISPTLKEPALGAPAGEWKQFKQELAIAQKTFDKVIVIGDPHLERSATERGTVYVPDGFWAGVERATSTPSKMGNRSLMADILKGLSGNVIGVSNSMNNEDDENIWNVCGPTSIDD